MSHILIGAQKHCIIDNNLISDPLCCCSGYEAACEEGPGLFAHVLTLFSLLLILATLPLSLLWVVKVVQVRHQQSPSCPVRVESYTA